MDGGGKKVADSRAHKLYVIAIISASTVVAYLGL